jgi:predicted flavoprotein YhiN
VAIIGGGPAGLMAAAQAAARGRKTILLEKNRSSGVKILLSGGTRCNLTHATDARGIVEAFGRNGRFLHSALAALDPEAVVEMFAAEGVPTKVEPGGKVFPASDRASDVRAALVSRVRRSGCETAFREPLVELTRAGDGFRLTTPQRSIEARKVVLATGGKSYPACGTTGDGYRWAAALGHRIVPPHEALTPVTSHAPWVTSLQGITLLDVWVRAIVRGKGEGDCLDSCVSKNGTVLLDGGRPTDVVLTLAQRRGAMLFAHFGVTGPAVLDVSRAVSGYFQHSFTGPPAGTVPILVSAKMGLSPWTTPGRVFLRCDLLPDMTEAALDAELAGAVAASGRRRAVSLLDPWLPRRVGQTILELAETPPDRSLGELSKAERRRIVETVKRLDIPASGTMGFRKAEVTAGGVALDEVDSRTMQSRLVPNLYFAGELLDLDGPVGGYNFQAAFSTGRLAGENV